jgi:hypothetical protein
LTTQAVIAPQTKPVPRFLSNGNNGGGPTALVKMVVGQFENSPAIYGWDRWGNWIQVPSGTKEK